MERESKRVNLMPFVGEGLRPLHHQTTADNEYQALMEAAPGHQPDEVPQEGNLAQAVDAIFGEWLTDREQWIVRAWVFEQMPIRDIALQLGISKTQVHRIKEAAFEKLGAALADNPTVKLFLQGGD